jgi:hypothetical protein
MSKPVVDAHNFRQLAVWVPKDVKVELEKRSADDGKPEREIVAEALVAHLAAAAAASRPRKKGEE